MLLAGVFLGAMLSAWLSGDRSRIALKGKGYELPGSAQSGKHGEKQRIAFYYCGLVMGPAPGCYKSRECETGDSEMTGTNARLL